MQFLNKPVGLLPVAYLKLLTRRCPKVGWAHKHFRRLPCGSPSLVPPAPRLLHVSIPSSRHTHTTIRVPGRSRKGPVQHVPLPSSWDGDASPFSRARRVVGKSSSSNCRSPRTQLMSTHGHCLLAGFGSRGQTRLQGMLLPHACLLRPGASAAWGLFFCRAWPCLHECVASTNAPLSSDNLPISQ
jgi:hypothetical protein